MGDIEGTSAYYPQVKLKGYLSRGHGMDWSNDVVRENVSLFRNNELTTKLLEDAYKGAINAAAVQEPDVSGEAASILGDFRLHQSPVDNYSLARQQIEKTKEAREEQNSVFVFGSIFGGMLIGTKIGDQIPSFEKDEAEAPKKRSRRK